MNTATEMTNALEASRAYQANVQAAEATKSLVSMALKIIA
ncbi:MAG: flagellar basal body rod C-terminal domain-containing protein [Planctomycetota bacterium]